MLPDVTGRVSGSDLDPLKLSLFSLANVNVDGTRNITIMDKVYTPIQAAQLLSLSDFAYSVVFLVFVVFWRFRVRNVVDSIDEDVTSMTDYSVRADVPAVGIVGGWGRVPVDGFATLLVCGGGVALTRACVCMCVCVLWSGHGHRSAKVRNRGRGVGALQQPVRPVP